MRISKRLRAKSLERSRALVGTDTALAFGIGFVGLDPRRTRWQILGGAIVFSIFLAAVIKAAFIPGWIVWYIIFLSLCRPVGVVVTDKHVFILERSVMTGKPKRIKSTLAVGTLAMMTQKQSDAYFHLDSSDLWIRPAEHQLLTSAEVTSP